ncbi:hypothetical protein M8J76_014831 [Diaphorina citri]|nr:hypothetical protein M8J75_013598 [Diaphorina citri]KAI5733699.1 hypothetical protein M8J76_014831 [Diaphorina citri]KAI5738067.1 hypothetical protein M8J77_002579 [Diaphorina citri]
MRVTVSVSNHDLFSLDVSPTMEVEQFRLICQDECGIDATDMILLNNGKHLLEDGSCLKQAGVRDGDIILVAMPGRGPTYHVAQSRHTAPHRSFMTAQLQDPAHVRDLLLACPDQLALLKQNNPRLSEALSTGKDAFTKVFKEQLVEREKRQKQKIKLMNAHPFDTHAQRLIAEEIRQKNVEANMEAAMEYNPETFGSVVMLYINCKVNGYPVKAFVDSGAQTTIMSAKCAERCNIMRLIDTRWAGVAKGVGVQQIIGRIHMVQVAIEKDFLTTSLSILEEQPMDMLLGLDMLRRHECCIDLRKNVLRIGTTGTETKFLPERELPSCARLTSASDEEEYF